MTSFERRLQKLEELLTDSTGLVPHSQEWLNYWRSWFVRRNSDPDFRPRYGMPLEAVRALVRNGLSEE